jgi:hypothetical protein
MISNITNLNPYSYHVSSSGASGKLFVPVNPSAVIYAQFNHISGIAAPKGQNGVSLSKIQILNSLIDNLSRIKGLQGSSKKSVFFQKKLALLGKYAIIKSWAGKR